MAALCAASPAFAQTVSTVQGPGKPGTQRGGVVTVQGDPAATPIPVTGTLSVSGAGNTIGSTVALNGNSVCATVWLAGQPGAAFDLASGTLATTLTPSISGDAAQSGNSCTGGNWTPTGFIDPATGNASPTQVVTNPNSGLLLNVRIGSAVCARVCTAAAATSGSASAFLLATVSNAVLAPAADVTDRSGRLLGKVTGSDGSVLATANTGRLQVDIITGGGSNGSVGSTGAAVPSSATYGGMNVAGNLTGLTGTANGLKVDPSAVTSPVSIAALPALTTGAATIGAVTAPGAAALALDSTVTTMSGKLPAALDGSGFLKSHEQGTAAISAASLPLPTLASTSTLQTTGNTSLGSIDGKLADGHGTAAAALRVELPTDGTGVVGLSAGTNVIGHVIADTGSTTAVTGNVTAVQATGTNLHAVLDTTSTTAVTQATGSNLHAQLDSGSTTAVTQTTAANLNATVTPAVAGHGTAATAMRVELPTDGTGLVNAAQSGTWNVTNVSGTVSLPTGAATETSLAKLPLAQGSTTSGQSGPLAQGAVTTSAPTYTTAQTAPLSLDTAGNLRVAGSFSAGAAADIAGAAVTLSAACATGASCGANTTALVALAGQSSVNVTFASGSSPLMTVVADCSKDGGTSYIMTGSAASTGTVIFETDAGVFSTSVVNPGNTSYALIAPDSCTHVRVRVGAYTSGTVSAQLRAVVGVPDGSGFTGVPGLALGYPPYSAGLMAQDSGTPTTGRALVADSTGLRTSPPANASSNVAQLAGTTTDTNSGTKSAGTLRVVLATDQPALTNKLLVTPDSVALPANQSVNISQINAVTPLMGNGTTGTGSQRVTIASDNTPFSVDAVGTVASGATAAGNPLGNGGRAATTVPTAVADTQRVEAQTDKFGRYMVGRVDRALISKSGVITLSTTTETTLLAAGGANVFLDVFYLHCVNSSTTATRVDIRDATAGTIRDVLECPAAAADCSGFNQALTPLPQTTANNNWTVQLSGAVTDVRCVAYAEQSK